MISENNSFDLSLRSIRYQQTLNSIGKSLSEIMAQRFLKIFKKFRGDNHLDNHLKNSCPEIQDFQSFTKIPKVLKYFQRFPDISKDLRILKISNHFQRFPKMSKHFQDLGILKISKNFQRFEPYRLQYFLWRSGPLTHLEHFFHLLKFRNSAGSYSFLMVFGQRIGRN